MSSSSRDPPPAHGHMAALLAARPWHVAVGSVAAGPRACDGAARRRARGGGAGAWRPGRLPGAVARGARRRARAGRQPRSASSGWTRSTRAAALVEDGRTVDVSAHLLTPPRPSAFGSSAEVGVTGGRLDGARLLLRVPRWARLPRGVRVGDELRLRGRLRGAGRRTSGIARGRAPAGRGGRDGGSFDFAAYLRRRGIAGELLLDDARATGRRRGGIAHVLDLMRERAQRAVAAGLPPPEAALDAGHGARPGRGDRGGRPRRLPGERARPPAGGQRPERDAAGCARAAAARGRRARPARARGRAARTGRPLRPAGGRRPLAPARRRHGRGGHRGDDAVAAGVALVRAAPGRGGHARPEPARLGGPRAGSSRLRPWSASSASACRWAARSLARRRPGRCRTVPRAGPAHGRPAGASRRSQPAGASPRSRPLARPGAAPLPPPRLPPAARLPALRAALARGLAEGAAITLAATLATAPLLAHHFDAVPVAGLPANLLALPAVAPAMWLGMVKAGLGLLAPLLPPLDWLAAALGPLTRLPVAYIYRLAELFAQLPGGQLSLPLPSRAGRADRLRAARAGRRRRPARRACPQPARPGAGRPLAPAPRGAAPRGRVPRWPRRSC